MALWHERDISHSSVERIILPDSTILIDYLLAKSAWLFSGLRVDANRMRSNFERTRGLIFSGQLLLDLSAAGMLREEAYTLVQQHASNAWEHDGDFQAAVASDPTIRRYLSDEKLRLVFSLARHQQHVDAIFQRVFGENADGLTQPERT